ncbi:hypothetical protein LTR64_006725 [Lithohypha guttulata]|uniref:uncharacterized protein n=1 Tax=Lithohypha guttulata TaxID=1690604 RepID=UPI002DDE3572|nr:hypothetical protein LTR51_004715 [Lithohypha guttulata]
MQHFNFLDLPQELQRKVLKSFLDDTQTWVKVDSQSLRRPDNTWTVAIQYHYNLPKAAFLVNSFFYEELKALLGERQITLDLSQVFSWSLSEQPPSTTRARFHDSVTTVHFHDASLGGGLASIAGLFPNLQQVHVRKAGTHSWERSRLCTRRVERPHTLINMMAAMAGRDLLSILSGDDDAYLGHLARRKIDSLLCVEDHEILKKVSLQMPFRFQIERASDLWTTTFEKYNFPGNILVIVVTMNADGCKVLRKYFARMESGSRKPAPATLVYEHVSAEDTALAEESRHLTTRKLDLPRFEGVSYETVEVSKPQRISGYCGTGAAMEHRSWFE